MNMNYAHNPILPADCFIPDVEAHAWGDGRIYLYGSFDIQGKDQYCSDVYHVYSSEDMVTWTDHGQAAAPSTPPTVLIGTAGTTCTTVSPTGGAAWPNPNPPQVPLRTWAPSKAFGASTPPC